MTPSPATRGALPALSRHPELSHGRVLALGTVLGMVTGVDFIATSMIAIAGAHIAGGVQAAPQEYLWTLTSYAGAAILANLLIGRLGRRITYRYAMIGGLAVFALGSLLCASASGLDSLVLARLVQGFGGGGLFTASRVMMQLISDPQERKRLFIGFGIGAFSLSALAPWLTALLVEENTWRAVFGLQALLALPVAGLVYTIAPRRLDLNRYPWKIGHLDWPSVVAFGFGAMMLLHGLEDFRYLRLTASPALGLMLFVGLALVLYAAYRQYRHPDPWLDPRRLGSRRYLVGLGFYILYYLFSGAWNSLLPSFLQAGLGFDFETTGYVLSVSGLVTLVVISLYSLNIQYFRGRRGVITVGYLLLAVASASLSHGAMSGVSLAVLLPAILLQGVTPVLVMVQVAGMTYLDFPDEDFAHAYQLKNILREIASALGTGMMSLQIQSASAQARNDLVGYVNAESLGQFMPGGMTPAAIARWSAEIDRQAMLVAGENLFLVLAAVCLIAAMTALVQRSLR